jgi:hypothetical protein
MVAESSQSVKPTILHIATISSLLLGMLACAGQRPVLSSNSHLIRVGPGEGQRDIDEYIARAEATLTETREASQENVVAGTATGDVHGPVSASKSSSIPSGSHWAVAKPVHDASSYCYPCVVSCSIVLNSCADCTAARSLNFARCRFALAQISSTIFDNSFVQRVNAFRTR